LLGEINVFNPVERNPKGNPRRIWGSAKEDTPQLNKKKRWYPRNLSSTAPPPPRQGRGGGCPRKKKPSILHAPPKKGYCQRQAGQEPRKYCLTKKKRKGRLGGKKTSRQNSAIGVRKRSKYVSAKTKHQEKPCEKRPPGTTREKKQMGQRPRKGRGWGRGPNCPSHTFSRTVSKRRYPKRKEKLNTEG